MSSILLVRHGQASWGAADYDVLSTLGEEQAVVVGEALAGLSPDVIVHGAMSRQRRTAELAAQDGLEARCRDLVRVALDTGHWILRSEPRRLAGLLEEHVTTARGRAPARPPTR